MELHGVKKFESDVLNLTYIAATTATSVDSKKLKADHPEIYDECSKVSNKKAYVKVVVK
jgi:predicted phage-related endonuclease